MNTFKSMLHWRVVAASVCGTSHIKNQQLCQDAHHWQIISDNIFVSAVADGAGSASLGKVGAMLAVQAAVESVANTEAVNRQTLTDDGTVRSLLMDAVMAAKTAVVSEAEACEKPIGDYSSTLILVIATPEMVAVAQIGDGVAVVKDYQGDLLALTLPDNGEYVNETVFLTSPQGLESLQLKILRQPIENVGVLTDGLQMLAINMSVGAPHKPFFFPLFDFIANTEDKVAAKEQLVKFLSSERITQRTDDDLTLVLAALSD